MRIGGNNLAVGGGRASPLVKNTGYESVVPGVVRGIDLANRGVGESIEPSPRWRRARVEQVYHEQLGLKQAPFRMVPDPEMFFSGGQRGEILNALMYAIRSGEGIVTVIGEVGTGKTMLCRMLGERLSGELKLVYLANPVMASKDLPKAIAHELGLALTPDTNSFQVAQRLQDHLLECHAQQKRVVVLVEEAQSMPVESLEEIRLLSNLETGKNKLLQLVLFGQPELDMKLSDTNIRQLRERISHNFQLTPLSRAETKDYLLFRLRCAGYQGVPIFSPLAVRAISKYAKGLVRRVNILADKAMLAMFAEQAGKVGWRHVRRARRDSHFAPLHTSRLRWLLGIGGSVVLAASSLALAAWAPA